MDTQSLLEKFIESIKFIYETNSYNNSNQYWSWIEQFQKSNEAWNVCFQAMERNVSPEVSYYAALTLQTKIRHELEKLPETQHSTLTEFLIKYMINYKPNMKITREICCGLASLAVQRQNWTNSFSQLVGALCNITSKNDTKSNEFSSQKAVIVFIHEFCNCVERTGHTRREQIRSQIEQLTNDILSMLELYLRDFPKNNYYSKLIYKTLGELVSTGSFSMASIIKSNIFQNICASLLDYNIEQCELSCDCSTSFVNIIYNLTTLEDKERQQYYGLFQEFSSKLVPAIQKAINESDIEYLKGIMDIHRGLLDVFESEVYDSAYSTNNQIFLDISLLICSYDDSSLLYELFNFWIDISQYISSNPSHKDASGIIQNYGVIFIKYLFQRLSIPIDMMDKTLYDIDDNDISDFRQYSIDVLTAMFTVLNPNDFLTPILVQLQQPNTPVNLFEASIYFLLGVIPSCTEDVNASFDFLINIIVSMPQDSPLLLQETSCKLLTELCKTVVSRNPSLIDSIFEFLLRCLTQLPVQMAASETMITYCEQGAKYLTHKLDHILNIINYCLANARDMNVVDSLTKCCTILLSKMDITQMVNKFSSLCRFQITYLNNLIRENTSGVNDRKLYAPIDTLSSVFKFLSLPKNYNIDHFLPIINEIISSNINIISIMITREQICEKCTRLLRYIFKFIGIKLKSPSDLVHTVVQWFNTSGFSCFLYLLCVFVDIFGDNLINHQWLFDNYICIAQITLTRLERPDPNFDIQFLLEDFMRYTIKTFRSSPALLLQSSLSDSIFLCSVNGILCEQKKAFHSCYTFLTIVFSYKITDFDPSYNEIKRLIGLVYQSIGRLLISNIAQNLFSRKSLALIEFSGELLVYLLRYSNHTKLAFYEETKKYLNSYNSKIVDDFCKNVTSGIEVTEAGRITRRFSIDLYGR